MAKGRVKKIGKVIPKTWEDALQEFLFLKRAQGRSSTTISDYDRHTRYFFKRFPLAFSDENLKQPVLEYMTDDIKPATFNIRREYLNAFFNWCMSEGILSTF